MAGLIQKLMNPNAASRKYGGRAPQTEPEQELLLQELFRDKVVPSLESMAEQDGQLLVHPDGPDKALVYIDGNRYTFEHGSQDPPPEGATWTSHNYSRNWSLKSHETVEVSTGFFSSEERPKVEISMNIEAGATKKIFWADGELSYLNRKTGVEAKSDIDVPKIWKPSVGRGGFETEWSAGEASYPDSVKLAKAAFQSLQNLAFQQPRLTAALKPLEL